MGLAGNNLPSRYVTAWARHKSSTQGPQSYQARFLKLVQLKSSYIVPSNDKEPVFPEGVLSFLISGG